MASSEFAVVYDGPLLSDGRMPVRELAPALLALGDLFVQASLAVYPDQEPVGLSIKATEEGSFLIQLVLHAPDAWDHLVNLLSSKPATALANLQGLVIGAGGGLFWLIKKLRGRAVVKEEEVSPGMVRLTLEDGTTFEVPREVLGLLAREGIRESARDVVQPVQRQGIDVVAFLDGDGMTVEITTDDVDAFGIPEPPEAPLHEYEHTMILEIDAPSFIEGNKWRLSDGANHFSATIEDAGFIASVNRGEPFRKGDQIECRMRIEQTHRGDSLHTERHVIEVLRHIPNPQLSMLDLMSGKRYEKPD